MKTFARWLARQKLRYDIGAGFMSVLTFAMALVGASDKIAGTLGISPRLAVAIVLPLAVLAVWAIGSVLDRLGFYNAYQDETNGRNQLLQNLNETRNRS